MKKLLLLFMAFVLAGCGETGSVTERDLEEDVQNLPGDNGNAQKPADRNGAVQKLAAAVNGFAFDLYPLLHESAEGKNLFFSPASIHLALAMTYNGAAGGTKEEMAAVLHADGMEAGELNGSYASFLNMAEAKKGKNELKLANSLWLKKGYPFLETYKKTVRENYGASLHEADFADPQTGEAINRWAEENTKGKIKNMVNRIPPGTVAYLLNAVYFNGKWAFPFNKEQNFEDDFYAGGKNPVTVEYMTNEREYPYFENGQFQAVELPYAGKEFSLAVILPKEGESLEEIVGQLTPEKWERWSQSFAPRRGTVTLPKFQMEYETSLNEPLQRLGMESAFSGLADFSNMVENGGVSIDEVRHKSYVRVDEKGTEAAAATSVAIVESAAGDSFHFKADRPFLFLIRENRSGMILFIGELTEPGAK